MLPVLLALGCALCYGGSDYTAGLAVRRAPLLNVTVTAEVVRALLVICVVPFASSQAPSPASLAWGATAGVSGVAGTMALSLGFRYAAFSVASPISAIVGAALPVIVGLSLGERLSLLSLAGIAFALPAILALSARSGDAGPGTAGSADMPVSAAMSVAPQAGRSGTAPAPASRLLAGATRRHLAGALCGMAAGTGFGLSLIGLNRAGSPTDLWPLVAAEVAAVATAATLAAATGKLGLPPPGVRWLALLSGAVAAAGLFCYFLATHRGTLSATAAIYAFFPAGTILLARVCSGERLTTVRLAGLGLAATSVAMIVFGGGR
jgi:drug/metabolite transporter (DMT)-like permease